MFKISVIIPVKNGAATLRNCLESIRGQNIEDFEIIVLDSMSTDNSLKIAQEFQAKVINIQEGTFNHGLTRNLGTESASGNLLYFTVQDAWLSENTMLEKMAAHFIDEQVMAVVGHQAIPWGHLDKNPAYWFKRFTQPEVEKRHFPNNTFKQLSDGEQFQNSSWDNVNAMYRRTAVIKVPFRTTNYSEDWIWANDALHNGMMLLRDPSLVVYHYHHMTFKYVYKASFIVYYNFLIFFKHNQKILWSPVNFLKAGYIILKRKEVKFSNKIYWILHNASGNLAYFISSININILNNRLKNEHFLKLSEKLPQGKQNT